MCSPAPRSAVVVIKYHLSQEFAADANNSCAEEVPEAAGTETTRIDSYKQVNWNF